MKNVLITGTSSGFGKATANHLSNIGYNVVGTSRNPLKTENNYKIVMLDLRDDESVQTAISEATQIMGSIDILINNAGYGLSGPIEETTIDEAKEQLEVNFWGMFRMTKAVLPDMRKQQKGLIINISSLAGLIGLPFQGFYSASKFAMEGFTEALRVEVKQFGIHVVNINPGDYHTSASQNRKIVINLTDIYRDKFQRILSLYEKDELNGGNPIEIAKLVEKLIKKEANYKVRYLTANPLQKAAAYLKKFISNRLFEHILISLYK